MRIQGFWLVAVLAACSSADVGADLPDPGCDELAEALRGDPAALDALDLDEQVRSETRCALAAAAFAEASEATAAASCTGVLEILGTGAPSDLPVSEVCSLAVEALAARKAQAAAAGCVLTATGLETLPTCSVDVAHCGSTCSDPACHCEAMATADCPVPSYEIDVACQGASVPEDLEAAMREHLGALLGVCLVRPTAWPGEPCTPAGSPASSLDPKSEACRRAAASALTDAVLQDRATLDGWCQDVVSVGYEAK